MTAKTMKVTDKCRLGLLPVAIALAMFGVVSGCSGERPAATPGADATEPAAATKTSPAGQPMGEASQQPATTRPQPQPPPASTPTGQAIEDVEVNCGGCGNFFPKDEVAEIGGKYYCRSCAANVRKRR